MPQAPKQPFSDEIPRRILQQFLEAVAEPVERGITRQEKLLLSFAELRFQMNGGGKCSLCRASVRHIIAVTAEHSDGTVKEHGCLCHRCLMAERAISERVTLHGGKIKLEYGRYGVTRKSTQKFRFMLHR
ncbi:MAG TPA: hypothetical protein VFU76_16920 [Terriglobales bacterium]|nr:hypothetical protein [Terriglobales bacterium]